MDWHRNYRLGARRWGTLARLGLPGLAAALLLLTGACATPASADSPPTPASAATPPPDILPIEPLPDTMLPPPLPASEALAQWAAGGRADLPHLSDIPGLAPATSLLLTLLSATSAPQFEAAGLSALGDALRRQDHLGDDLLASLGAAIDSDLANRILAAGILPPPGKPGVAGGRPAIVMGRLRIGPDKPPAGPPDPGAGLALSSLGSQSFGRPDTLALGLRGHVGDGAALNTDVEIRHSHGPLDVDFNLTGKQPLLAEKPMQLAYTGAAFVSVSDSLKVGMIAKGDLGTISAPTPLPDQTGSALAKLRLLGKNSVLSAETGYDFPLGTTGDGAPPHYHVNLNFDLKL